MVSYAYSSGLYPNILHPVCLSCEDLPETIYGHPNPLAWGNPFFMVTATDASDSEDDSISEPEINPEPIPEDPTTNENEPLLKPQTENEEVIISEDEILILVNMLHSAITIKKQSNLTQVLHTILPNKNYQVRMRVMKKYEELYKSNLLEELKKQINSTEYFYAIRCFLESYEMLGLRSLWISMEGSGSGGWRGMLAGAGTDESALCEVLFESSNHLIDYYNLQYPIHFPDYGLIQHIKDETSGKFLNFLLELCIGKRDESANVNMKEAKDESRNFYAMDKDDRSEQLITILCKRSMDHIKIFCSEFQNLSGIEVDSFILDNISKDFIIVKDFMNATSNCIAFVRDKIEYYAKRLHESLEVLRNNSIVTTKLVLFSCRHTVVRIIVSRWEVDLVKIMAKYESLTQNSLECGIDTSVKELELKQLLLAVINNVRCYHS